MTEQQQPVVPRNGAGIFEGDPDQSGVSQDPNVVVTGDIDALPDDFTERTYPAAPNGGK